MIHVALLINHSSLRKTAHFLMFYKGSWAQLRWLRGLGGSSLICHSHVQTFGELRWNETKFFWFK
jgi:hypothetical protein